MNNVTRKAAAGRSWKMIAGIGALAVVLSACASTPPASTPTEGVSSLDEMSLEELTVAAQAEGCLNLYTSIDVATTEATLAAFDEEYGISGTYVRADSAGLSERMKTEHGQNLHNWDVLIHSVADDVTAFNEAGELAPLTGLPAYADWPTAGNLSDYSTAIGYHLYALAWNTNLVTDPNAIKSPRDLIEYAPRIGGPDPTSSLNFTWMYHVADEADASGTLLEDLADAGFTIGASWPTEEIGAGEIAAGFGPAGLLKGLQAQGAPIDFVYLSPAVGAARYVAIPEEAECAAAGRLFANFTLTEKGQEIINKGLTSPLPGIKGTDQVPSDYTPLDATVSAANIETIDQKLRGR